MQEDFLHYVWNFKKINAPQIKTTNGEEVSVVQVGMHNQNAGPDFFNAQVYIGKQLWAGNVEIHLKSSDWYVHHHEKDTAYDNVVLHVVWEHDTEVFRKDNSVIPTLELKDIVEESTLVRYQQLFSKKQKWINCENSFSEVDSFTTTNWLERLYFERLERKAVDIEVILKQSKNNWEEVLFELLAKNFGLKVNAESFLSIASSIDFSIIRKIQSKPLSLEALFLGQAGLLNDTDIQEPYFDELLSEYQFLKKKYQLDRKGVLQVHFFRLRPNNFPTIRLSQLAILYSKQHGLFSKIINAQSLEDIYNIFEVETSTFWKTHYTFSKASKKSVKKITRSFVDLLIINTIIPLKFCYAAHHGNIIDEEILQIMSALTSEKNAIIEKFNSLKKISSNALFSQALLQLKNEYCNKNKCLQCAVGSTLIS